MPAQVAVLGACVSILAGLFVAYAEQEEARERWLVDLLERLRIPLAPVREHDLFDQYCVIAEALADLADQPDTVLRQFARLKLSSIAGQVESPSQGTVVFSSTGTWRTVYEQLLESPGLTLYQSVAWVKTRDYWQAAPGRQSMRLNFDLVQRGLRIERILILRAGLSSRRRPPLARGPALDSAAARSGHLGDARARVGHRGGPDLLADWGIYGDRATGVQELDDQSRTFRFILDSILRTFGWLGTAGPGSCFTPLRMQIYWIKQLLKDKIESAVSCPCPPSFRNAMMTDLYLDTARFGLMAPSVCHAKSISYASGRGRGLRVPAQDFLLNGTDAWPAPCAADTRGSRPGEESRP